MTAQHLGLELLERTFDRECLFHDVDAVDVFLDHFADPFDVSLDRRQARVKLGFLSLHVSTLTVLFTPYPPPGGMG
jgi:hypothetical protein